MFERNTPTTTLVDLLKAIERKECARFIRQRLPSIAFITKILDNIEGGGYEARSEDGPIFSFRGPDHGHHPYGTLISLDLEHIKK